MNKNDLHVIADEMFPILSNDIGEKFVDARTLHENLMVGKDFTNWIKDRINQYGFEDEIDFSPYSAKTSNGGRPRNEYLLTLDCAKEIAMVQNNEIGRYVRRYFIKIEKQSRFKQPKTHAEMFVMAAQQMLEQDKKIRQIQADQQRINHRIDSLDGTNIEGDRQQRFNKMIKRYAWQEGLQLPKAWKEFDQAFNTAFRTNITAKRQNYADRHGFKSLSRPQYLSITDQLEDAIRVADKMLNQKSGVVNA